MMDFCLKYWASNDELLKEFEVNLPLLKEKHQDDRKEAPTKLNLEFGDWFRKWCQNHDNIGYNSSLPKRLRDERELLKFCKFIDQILLK